MAPLRAVALLLLVWLAPAVAAQDGASPWSLLEGLRDGMREAGPLTARFTQTFIPPGFQDGDQEQGHLSLWLPRCLRWNYDEGKSFLICEGEVHQWNEDEKVGRRYRIDPAQESGLDLLLVDVNLLRERYVASSEQRADGGYDIHLQRPGHGDLGEGAFKARIRLNPEGTRVTAMEYSDAEGNLSRFEIDTYQPLAHEALFRPPTGVQWATD